MSNAPFSESIKGLPRAEIPLPGVHGWLLQGSDHQLVFFEIEPIGEIPAHHHSEQWGVVVEGEMELTIGGVARLYRAGDSDALHDHPRFQEIIKTYTVIKNPRRTHA